MSTTNIKNMPANISPPNSAKPLVAIRCITYNHEPYIRDALEGFVMQKTDFPFVAIVHDDASTDKTADIIREYAAKYPDIIKPIYETENQYSKPGNPLGKLMNAAVLATGAKYIALCEGDDYWTDPLKLQKQVDFLESHPECALIFADIYFQYPTGLTTDSFGIENRYYEPLELYKRQLIAPATMLYKAEVYNSKSFLHFQQIKKPVMGDLTLYMACSTIGKIYGDSTVVANYRRMPTGATNYLFRYPYRLFKNRIALSNYLGKEYKKIDARRFALYFLSTLRHPLKDFPEYTKFAFRLFWFCPVECLKEFKKIPRLLFKHFKDRIAKYRELS